MKRTNVVLAVLLASLIAPAFAQEPNPAAAAPPQADPIEQIVAAMRAGEQRARSFRLDLATTGQLQAGLEFSTKGTLRVLRGAQPAMHMSVEFTFADGLLGRMESAQTSTGIVLFSDDPVAGELFVHVDATTVADLEWAGTVLDRSDLPGMADRRATAPLGSGMVDELRRSFALTVTDRSERDGEAGAWLSGPRRNGADDQDPDLPLADRVELFVRNSDHALLEVRHLQRDKVLQRIVVTSVQIDVDIPPATFAVDGRGVRLREVQQYPPMWDQIEQVLRQAENKAGDAQPADAQPADAAKRVRPSRRK